jgi:phosphate transport system substrate-binding protein
MRSRIAAGFVLCLSFALPAAAQPMGDSWYGDLASARGYMVDAARLYEIKNRRKATVKAISTVAALDQLAQGKVDLVGSARMADTDNPFERDLVFTPVVWDAMVMVASPTNPVANLTLEQIADIYLGRITDWSALGGPAKAINLYVVAGPDDGVEFSLRRLVLGNGNRIVAAKRWYINTQQLEDAIAIDPAAVAVTTLSSVHGRKDIKVFSVDGVVPGAKTLDTYPLITPLYIASRGPTSPQGDSEARARRAIEFLSREPALRAAWRSKQLVPAVEGKALVAAFRRNEQAIAERLAFAVAPVPVNVVSAEQVATDAALVAPAPAAPAGAAAAPLPAAAAKCAQPTC